MKLFTCHVCAEKERRIADLFKLIEHYKALATPNNNPFRLPAIQMEADAVLSGQQHIIDLRAPSAADQEIANQEAQADDEQSEASRLLSGSY